MNVVRRAVDEPMRWSAANAGHEASVAALLLTTEAVMSRMPEMASTT
jgi:hypothetical protein